MASVLHLGMMRAAPVAQPTIVGGRVFVGSQRGRRRRIVDRASEGAASAALFVCSVIGALARTLRRT